MFYGGSEFSAIFPLIVACFITDIVAAACYPCCLYICSCVASCLDAVRSRACPFLVFAYLNSDVSVQFCTVVLARLQSSSALCACYTIEERLLRPL